MIRARNKRRSTETRGISGLLQRLSPRRVLRRHAQVALDSLGRLSRNKVGSSMTAAVIAIALAMPAGLFLLLDNLERLSGSWDGQASLSVFLRNDIDAARARSLQTQVDAWPETGSVELVTPAEALEAFTAQSGFADVLGGLGDNPLPHVLIVQPAERDPDPAAAAALQARLTALPETEQAQLDLEWVQRLDALLEIAHRIVMIIGVLLALAVMLVIGNTIRLEIENRRDEIVVTKLIGATNSFVRQPFLYSGFWYGALGALIAWAVVEGGFWLLHAPVARLAGLYQSDFAFDTLPGLLLLALLAGGVLLGLLGAWLAVGRHLDAIEPT